MNIGHGPRTRLLAAFVAVTLTACATPPQRTGSGAETALVDSTPPAGGEVESLRWVLGAEPPSLDWVYAYDYPPNTVLANVCESLLRIGPDFAAQPNLAASVENPDPLTWIYRLRSGVTFHDGTPMTSEDVAFSLNRHRDKQVGSYWSAAFSRVTDITATAPDTVTVTLSAADPLFNQMMAVAPGVVESKAYLTAKAESYGTPDGGVSCTGPFRLDRWAKGQSIRLVRNEAYWDVARAAKARAAEFVFVADPAAQVNALSTGEVDGVFGPPVNGRDALSRSGVGNLYYGRQTSTINLIVGDLKGPLADVRIRRALSLAIDREGFITAALGGNAEPSRAVAAKLTWGQGATRAAYEKAWNALPAPKQDIEAAKRLVAEAGAPSRPIVLATSASPVVTTLGNEVQAAAQRIGLRVELKTLPVDAYGGLFGSAKSREGIDLFYT
ncbi:MAG: ABC transporter substrate-binding protein, partial [Actinomycetota bacterium]|nr:ABC transporter substrate-binding protein [Actinomycetota bacterium]